jgi:hypothetical protein
MFPCSLLWNTTKALGSLTMDSVGNMQEGPVVHNVISNPSLVWGVGPLFAALTGIAFKEGMCYGRAEAAVLFFVTPALLLVHLSRFERFCITAYDSLHFTPQSTANNKHSHQTHKYSYQLRSGKMAMTYDDAGPFDGLGTNCRATSPFGIIQRHIWRVCCTQGKDIPMPSSRKVST